MNKPLRVYFEASMEEISKCRVLLGNPYAFIDEDSPTGFSALSKIPHAPHYSSHDFIKDNRERYSIAQIEEVSRRLLNRLWKDKILIWPDANLSNPSEVIDPIKAIELLGYDFNIDETLGQFHSNGKLIEVAGTIDKNSKQVRISMQFSSDIRRFTAAHELGHALMHHESGLHRDRPVDGVTLARNHTEFEADKFATYFLMPEKLVRDIFIQLFLTKKFILNEGTAFALGHDYQSLIKEIKIKRQLSRLLASAERYNGRAFISIAENFGVSVESMAIRLEELELLEI